MLLRFVVFLRKFTKLRFLMNIILIEKWEWKKLGVSKRSLYRNMYFLYSEVHMSLSPPLFPYNPHNSFIWFYCFYFTLASIVLLVLRFFSSLGNKEANNFFCTLISPSSACVGNRSAWYVNLLHALICTQDRDSYFEIGFLLNISIFFKLMLRFQKMTEEAALLLSILQITQVSQFGMFCNHDETFAFTVDLNSKHFFPHFKSIFFFCPWTTQATKISLT